MIKERQMEVIHEYFSCDACKCQDFKRIYKFSMRLHGINFSDDLIYDKIIYELYQCTECQKTFTIEQIEDGLERIRLKYR